MQIQPKGKVNIVNARASAKAKPKAGRPTRDQAEARQEELLDAALNLFLDRGFELTTMEGVAAAVRMTKRTIYAKYPDKAALFRASVERAIARYSVPATSFDVADSDDLEASLIAVARARIANLMTPEGIRLQRILNAESYRFPEIFELFSASAAQPIIAYVAQLLSRHAGIGSVAAAEPERAAVAFMGMVLGPPARSLIAGSHIAPAELERRIRFSVRLFLNGVRPR
jgi:TetR/AcrR family transcriptional regulator, mexJK operon transcriptional repressor